MKPVRFCSTLFVLALLMFVGAPETKAQTESWVSRNGSDSNSCALSSPCRTFAGAFAKTPTEGEIRCLDTGSFGGLTITHQITIDCAGTGSNIFGGSDGGAVININVAATDTVTIRNLSISFRGVGIGVNYGSGKAVHLENVTIYEDFLPGSGATCIAVQASAPTLLTVDNASLSECVTGVFASTSSGTAVVNINNSRIFDTVNGVVGDNGSRMTVRNSTIYFNDFGISQANFAGSSLGSTITVVNSTLGYSSTAAIQSRTGEFILAFGNTFVNDVIAFSPNGGSIFTGADNTNSGSSQGTANGGSVPKF